MSPLLLVAAVLGITGLAYTLLWPLKKMRAGRILKTVALPHPLGRLGGWFMMAAGVVMIVRNDRMGIDSPGQLLLALTFIVVGYLVEATRRGHFKVAELGILRFPSFFRWTDIERMDWSGATMLKMRLKRRIVDPVDPRFLRSDVYLSVPPSQIEAFRELLDSKGVDVKNPEALFWPSRPTSPGES
jgi:hypothetical protein